VPKIPLYNKGLGPSVDLATGQLGTSVDAQALSSPARQLAALGETIGRAGQTFAQNQIKYNSRKARIDFEFEKAEQNREANKTADELSLEFEGLADDYILNSSTSFTTTAAATSAFNESITSKAKAKIAGLSLTDRQKSLIEAKVLNGLAPKLSNAKRNAYNHGTNESTRAHDARVDNRLTQITGSEPVTELAAISLDLQQSANTLIANGGSPKIAPHQIEQAVLISASSGAITSATDFERLDEIEEGIPDLSISSAAKTTLLTAVNTKRTALAKEINDGVIGNINSLPLEDITSSEFDSAIASVREGNDVITLMLEVPAANGRRFEAQRIDLTDADESMRGRVLSALISARDKKETEENVALVDSVKTAADGLPLPQLTNEIELAKTGKGFAEGTEGAVRSSILRALESEFNSRKPQVEAQIRSNNERILDNITRSDGVITDETQDFIDQTVALYSELGQDVEAADFQNTVKATVNAGEIFSNIQFASPAANKEAVDALAKEVEGQAVDAPVRASITQKSLNEMIKQRKVEMENDPVRYLTREKGELSIDEVIALQRTMGVAEVDIRVTDNATILSFRNEYDQAETYDAKAEVLENFIEQFGVNQARVMRHLTKTKAISLVDNVIASLGSNNIYAKSVFLGNQPEGVERAAQTVAKGGLGSTVLAELRVGANERMREYSSSIIGGVLTDGVLGGGVQDGRTSHVIGMEDIVVNTAAYIQMADRTISSDDALDAAFEAVIGNQYVFSDINGTSVRFESSLEGDYVGMTGLLEFSLTQSEDYLRSVVAPPQRREGESDQDFEDRSNEYFSDLAQRGTWRTTVDNQGLFMVDQLGGLVELLEPEDSDEPFAAFVFTSMDQVQNLLAQERAFSALSMDERRAKLTEMGYDRPTATLTERTALTKWRELTFAKGPLF